MEKILTLPVKQLTIIQLTKYLRASNIHITQLLKYLALLFFLFLSLSVAQAQQNKDYYYFGATKVFVKQSTEKLYVRMKEDAALALKATLQRDYKLPENVFTPLQADNFMVINLKDLGKNEQKQLITELANSNNVEMSRPLLIARDGKEVVVDEGFYVKLKHGVSDQQLKDFALQKNCILNETPYKYDAKIFFLKAGAANSFDGLHMANVFLKAGYLNIPNRISG